MRLVRSIGVGRGFLFRGTARMRVFARAAGVECGARGASGGAARRSLGAEGRLHDFRSRASTRIAFGAAETRARPAAERRKP